MRPNDKLMYRSSLPASIVVALIIDISALSFFAYVSIFEELSIVFGIVYPLLSVAIVDKVLCPHAGRITLSQEKLTISYYFPWYKSIEIEIKRIKEIDTYKPRYMAYSEIYITADNNESKTYRIQTWYNSEYGIKIVKDQFEKLTDSAVQAPINQ